MFNIGSAKVTLYLFRKGRSMMGYGLASHMVESQESELFARAFFVEDPKHKKRFCFVNVEICFITSGITQGVVSALQSKHKELGITASNLMLTAQHTHSAPGGYSQCLIYNVSSSGFVPEIHQALVDGIVMAIVKASAARQPARLKYGIGEFASHMEVAFNRSIKAYNQNPEVEEVGEGETHLAVDRTMRLLRVEDAAKQPIGLFNWFGVHGTSISSKHNTISSDNKGYAATYLEEELKSKHSRFVAAFAQGASGDISPNNIGSREGQWARGKCVDEFKSAQFNGLLQMKKALEVFEQAVANKALSPEVDHVLMKVDFTEVAVAKEFTGNIQGAKTSPPCFGLAFLRGTAEGPGMRAVQRFILKYFSHIAMGLERFLSLFSSKARRREIATKYEMQGAKDIVIASGKGKILGIGHIKTFFLPAWLHPTIKLLKELHHNGYLPDAPWSAQVLPLQLIVVGDIVIAGIPGEISTMAAKRLQHTILDVVRVRGIREVIISSFANAYGGYITTREEYAVQEYEGGHTVYGKWTLAAFQTKFKFLAEQLLLPPEQREVQ